MSSHAGGDAGGSFPRDRNLQAIVTDSKTERAIVQHRYNPYDWNHTFTVTERYKVVMAVTKHVAKIMTQYLGKKMPTLWQDPQYSTDGLAMYTAFLNRILRRSEEGEDRAKKAYYALKQGVGTESGYETLEDFEARAAQLKKTFDMCKVISEDPNDTAEVGTARDVRHKYFNDLHPRFDPVVERIKAKEIEYRQTRGAHGRHYTNDEIWQSLIDYQHTMHEKRPKVKAFHPPSSGMTRVTKSVANAATGVANVSVKDSPMRSGESGADSAASQGDGGRGERKRSKRPCFAFRRTGKCKFGDKCRFSHNQTSTKAVRHRRRQAASLTPKKSNTASYTNSASTAVRRQCSRNT